MSERPKKTRRTREELKAALQAKIKLYDIKQDAEHKRRLQKLGEELKEIADARPSEKHLAAASAQILGWASAIKAEIPQ